MKIRIEVTRGAIDKGAPFLSTRCPIARAIRGTIRMPVGVVDRFRELPYLHIFTEKTGNFYFSCDLPLNARSFVAAFDNAMHNDMSRRLFRPFHFYIDISKMRLSDAVLSRLASLKSRRNRVKVTKQAVRK